MATRGYIARIERDGSGELIYLGHSSQPTDAGKLLLEHYSDAEAITELLQHGSVCHLNETTVESIFYHHYHNHHWDNCHPVTLHDGTEGLFGKPYQPGPEWLYAWTPDGWLAAAVDRKVPQNYVDQIGRMGVAQLEDWFQHNPDPQWIAWRAAAVANQRPVPLSSLIDRYSQGEAPDRPVGFLP